ncbi:MAG: redoxin domain-containing protein [Actinomycetota bacterium]|nr:redoxin domain-containing protein [Actinomycetota bacterium]
MRSRVLGAVAAALLLSTLAACGDDDDPAAEATGADDAATADTGEVTGTDGDDGSDADEATAASEDGDAADGDAGAADDAPDGVANELLAFDGELLSGGSFSGADLSGRDAVLWFWAPWCTICRAEAPDVVEVVEAFEGEVPFIGVASRGPLEDMEAFVEETGTGGFEHLADVDGSIWERFEVVSQPTFAFIDDSGEIEVITASYDAGELTERLEALTAA